MESFPGIVQILNLIRAGLSSLSSFTAKFIPYSPQKIQLWITVILCGYISYKASKLIPDSARFIAFWIIGGLLFYLLNYYGL
jgi:hypothetical protein